MMCGLGNIGEKKLRRPSYCIHYQLKIFGTNISQTAHRLPKYIIGSIKPTADLFINYKKDEVIRTQ